MSMPITTSFPLKHFTVPFLHECESHVRFILSDNTFHLMTRYMNNTHTVFTLSQNNGDLNLCTFTCFVQCLEMHEGMSEQ